MTKRTPNVSYAGSRRRADYTTPWKVISGKRGKFVIVNLQASVQAEVVWGGSPVMELFRLAPEMEQELRYFVFLKKGSPTRRASAARILEALDAAGWSR